MRVLMGTNWSLTQAGGVPSHLGMLTRGLTARGIQNAVVNPDDRFQTPLWKAYALLVAGGSSDGGRVKIARMRPNDIRRQAGRLIARDRYDLVHAHDALFGRVALEFGLPVVMTIHGPLSKEVLMFAGKANPQHVEFLRQSEHLAYAGAKALIAVDTGQGEIARAEFGVPATKVRVIPNAVDTTLFAPHSEESGGAPFFLVPRRLVKKNGVSVAIEALSRLKGEHVELWVAGEGPERARLADLARRRGLAGQVRFLGSVDQAAMARLVSQSLGVIVPSIPVDGVVEATSIAALEGMAAAKPVFASNLGGLSEVIQHGETGLLFEAGDHQALGTLLLEALTGDRERLVQVGRKARSHVERYHGVEAWTGEIIKVYEDVLAR